MLFVEGNHFCPGCEKSGNCQLQALGYEFEMTTPHFVHFYPESRRRRLASRRAASTSAAASSASCACARAATSTARKCSRSAGAGLTRKLIVNSPSGKLGDSAFAVTDKAAHVCPVGAILIKRVGFVRADRRAQIRSRADQRGSRILRERGEAEMNADRPDQGPVKVRLATTSLAGCFGCHMSLLDIDERLFELAEIAEFDRSPLTDIKHCGPCDIALIEGGVCNTENVHVVRELRANAKILVAVGACAINGGLPALRNKLDVNDILTRGLSRSDDRRVVRAESPSCRCRSTWSIRSTRSSASTISCRAARRRATRSGSSSPTSSSGACRASNYSLLNYD